MPTFELLATGEELMSGALVDTNTAWLSQELCALGLEPGRFVTVGDVPADIVAALRESAGRAAVVVVTGGLGPTSDDWSREAAAEAFGLTLYQDDVAWAQVQDRYRSRGREPTALCHKQATFPVTSTILENRWGTAPGFSMEANGTLFFFLPGVPFEMKAMYAHHLTPTLQARFALAPRQTVVLRCIGLPESQAAAQMEGFDHPGVVIGYRAAMPEVHVKLHIAPGADADAAVVDAQRRLGTRVFGVNCGPLAEVMGERLRARGETIATAESCTAGRLAAALTARAGASDYMIGGAVVYANAEKVRQCGVDPDTLNAHGAVSEAVARQLAEGIRARVGTTWGLATTGIAGPGGGTPEKPVGTVHIAVAGPTGTLHRALLLPGDRERVMAFTVGLALDLLRKAMGPT